MKKKLLAVLFSFLVLTGILLLFSACADTSTVNTEGMYLVIYNGNGGYLGDKVTTTRRLYCYPGSKLPSYPMDYEGTENTISSLGLAQRNGYLLKGWYLSDELIYSEDALGSYVYFDTEAGNGVYREDENGPYVYAYDPDENGKFVEIVIERPAVVEEGEETTEALTYIYINKTVIWGDDETILPGFYICGGQADVDQLDDIAKKDAYQEALDRGTFAEKDVLAIAGWQIFDELSDANRTLLADLPRYTPSYRKALEGDERDELFTHYALTSDYVNLEELFVQNENGAFVHTGTQYELYDSENPAHATHVRYALVESCVFTPSEEAPTPFALKHYDVAFTYWDFKKDTVTEDLLDEEGKMVLYAHWVKKNTVYYHYENGTGQIDESTTRLESDNITKTPLTQGEVIGKKEIVPVYAGHTFVGWSKSPTSYEPWDFANDVFPENTSALNLYAYYVEGDYTRIISAKGLAEIAKNPAGKYILAENIDLGGAEYSGTMPTGLNDSTAFTGEFISFGKKITNFTLKVSSSKKSASTATALFPRTEGARIEGLTLDCKIAFTSSGKPIGSDYVTLSCAAFTATADSATVIKNCTLNATVTATNKVTSAEGFTLVIADFAITGTPSVTDCVSNVDISALGEDFKVTDKTSK